jgi:CHAT domain-containing protein/tetratricopeptide (TPR) repeat protein
MEDHFFMAIPMKWFVFVYLLLIGTCCLAQDSNPRVSTYVIDSIMSKAGALFKQADRDGAVEFIQEAKGLAKAQWGIESRVYGDVCQQEGRYLERMGEYNKALKAYQSAVEARQNTLPQVPGDLAESLKSLANVSRTLGKYGSAISSMTSLVQLMERGDFIDQDGLYDGYAELARLYREIGHFTRADSFYINASDLPEKNGTPMPASLPMLLHDWGRMCMDMGHYQKSEDIFQQAEQLFNKDQKKNAPEYVMVLAGLATLYHEMGQEDKAKSFFLEAKKKSSTGWLLWKKLAYGPVLNGLCDLYRSTNESKKAEDLYLSALDIMEADAKKGIPEYPALLHQLGVLYHEMGDDEEAELFFKDAIKAWKKLVDGQIPGYPKTMMDMAAFYVEKGDYIQAKNLLINATSFWENKTGTSYPIYFYCLFDLAKVYWISGDFALADSLYAQAAFLGRHRLAQAVQYMSGNELDEYLRKFLHYQAEMVHFATTSPVATWTAEACYNNTLFYKGFLLHATIQLKNQALRDPMALPMYNALTDYRRQIGTEYTKPIDERQDMASLNVKADSLEKELACMLTRNEELFDPVTWQDIQHELSPNEAAIEFVYYQVINPVVTDSIVYVAQLILPNSTKPIHIPLFEEGALAHLLDGSAVRKADFVNNLYTQDDRGLVQLGKPVRSIYDIIWKPLEAVLPEEVTTIHIAPAGVLHRLNFGAIALSQTEILSEKYKINLLESTRKLIPNPYPLQENQVKTAYVFSGIDYNSSVAEMNIPDANKSDSAIDTTRPVDQITAREEQFTGTWSDLFWTVAEGDSITSLFSSAFIRYSRLTGKEAREEDIKKIGDGEYPSPEIIHLATHGFFYPDPDLVTGKSATRFKESSIPKEKMSGSVFKILKNPMFRSGLIMAGANNAWQNRKLSGAEWEDGVLTAYEVSQLNLFNTELVVLSACETGLGDIQGNEGVYGLQRAFKIAGAKYLIMSLWQVPDRETMEFMTTFYKNWLPSDAEALAGKEGKMTIPDAFRKTQREMRDRFFNPYSWAGFVLVE